VSSGAVPAAGLTKLSKAVMVSALFIIVLLSATVAYLGGRIQERSQALLHLVGGPAPAPEPVPETPAPAQPEKTPAPVPAAAPAPAPAVATQPAPVAPSKPATTVAKVDPQPAATPVDDGSAAIAGELDAIRGRIGAKQLAQAAVAAQTFIDQHPSHRLTPDAYMLLGDAEEGLDREGEAAAAYASVVQKFKGSPRAPEALVRQAEIVLRSRQAQKEASARQLYTRVADEYPKSDWAPRALAARAQIEEKSRDRVMDPSIGTYVPAVLPTYRAIAERYPAQSEEALWRMSEIFADLNRYPMQGQALLDLANRFPQSKYDPYWRLGEVREKRLQDKPGAIDAYSKVPPSSSKYKNAEKRVQDLRKK